MKSEYLIDKATLKFLRELYEQERASHPDCQLGFGWGGDSTGWTGVNCGVYYDTSEPMPPIYCYEDVSLHFAFPYNMPEELKSGVVCFRDKRFKILPVEDFDSTDLVEGILKESEDSI